MTDDRKGSMGKLNSKEPWIRNFVQKVVHKGVVLKQKLREEKFKRWHEIRAPKNKKGVHSTVRLETVADMTVFRNK